MRQNLADSEEALPWDVEQNLTFRPVRLGRHSLTLDESPGVIVRNDEPGPVSQRAIDRQQQRIDLIRARLSGALHGRERCHFLVLERGDCESAQSRNVGDGT